MDQKINNSQNEFLWALLANPANDAHLYSHNLQRLVNDFPQSGILQALLAHASEEKNLKQASVYFNAQSLYKLINTPSALTGVAGERIIIQPGLSSNGLYHNYDQPVVTEPAAEQSAEAGQGEKYFSDQSEIVTDPETSGLGEVPEVPVSNDVTTPLHDTDTPGHQLTGPEPEIENNAGNSADVEAPVAGTDSALLSYTGSSEEEPGHIEPATGNLPPAADGHHPITDIQPPSEPIAQDAETLAEENQPITEIPPALPENGADVAGNQPPVEEESKPAEQISSSLPENTEPVSDSPGAAVEKDEPLEERNISAENNELLVADEHSKQEEDIAPQARALPIEEPQPEKDIEDETYDEIVGIENINLKPGADHSDESGKPADKLKDEEEKLILTNIAADDYFMFDRAFGEHTPAGQQENGQAASSAHIQGVSGQQVATDKEKQDVSKYNDEKMPYTFMWWLDKTRKEHAGISQPYAKPGTGVAVNKPKSPTDELQQQYYENIFHITPSVEELDKSAAHPSVPFAAKRKEHVIIERFIQEEPQIKPQSSDKLDNENKAKKSSEDRDELVTETLAGIYSDQMLYHKAIASYKKLMLKFPEKSRYFAGKIEQLEKKTN